jgi:hypothetical protein
MCVLVRQAIGASLLYLCTQVLTVVYGVERPNERGYRRLLSADQFSCCLFGIGFLLIDLLLLIYE